MKKLLAFAILAVFILFNFYLLSKTLFYDSAGNIRAAYSGYGDIPFHLTQVSKFSYGSLFDLNEPIFTGDHIRYSFFINWLSGLFFKITHSFGFSFHFPAMFFAAMGIIFTFLIYRKILKAEWLALLAVFLFFLGSGLVGYYLLSDHFFSGEMNWNQFADFLTEKNLFSVTTWGAEYPRQNVAWGAPLGLVFMHQRSFLLGYFLFSLFFCLLLKFHEKRNKKYLISLAVILGISPLGHYHSFLAMGFVLVLFATINWFKKDREMFKKIVLVLLLAFVISLPQIIYLTAGKNNIVSGANSFVKLRLGWMADPSLGSIKYPSDNPSLHETLSAYLNYLWINFGIILPLFVFSAFWAFWKKRKEIYPYVLAGAMFFILAQIFKFQPWDYDNNKLLVYFQFFASPVLIYLFAVLTQKRKILGAVLFAGFFIIAVHSGAIDVIPRYKVDPEKMPVIFSREAVETADFVRANINEDDQILTTSTHLNPINSLAGRPAIVGYPGWLWTKGLEWAPRENDMKSFFANPDRRDILEKYSAKYVLLDPAAVYDWRADKEKFDSRFPAVFSSGQYILYKTDND